MTKPKNNPVRLGNPAEVMAAVPHLLGFTPTDSLVVVGLHEVADSAEFGLTLRADLPAPEHRRELVEYMATGPLVRQGATAVLVVVVGGGVRPGEGPPGSSPPTESTTDPAVPEQELVALLHDAFSGAGVSVLHALWTAELCPGGEYRCYAEACCNGEIPDPKGSALGATLAAAGAVTFDSRQDLQQLVAPESEREVARWSARLERMVEDNDPERAGSTGARRDVEIVFAAIRRIGAGEALTEDDLLQVLVAVSDSRVRDLCLSLPFSESAMAAEQLWLNLVRKAPAPEVADVAVLLAFSTYLRGEGALAGIALERVEACRPEHPLGCLLRQALNAGVSPQELQHLAKDAVQDAELQLDENGERW